MTGDRISLRQARICAALTISIAGCGLFDFGDPSLQGVSNSGNPRDASIDVTVDAKADVVEAAPTNLDTTGGRGSGADARGDAVENASIDATIDMSVEDAGSHTDDAAVDALTDHTASTDARSDSAAASTDARPDSTTASMDAQPDAATANIDAQPDTATASMDAQPDAAIASDASSEGSLSGTWVTYQVARPGSSVGIFELAVGSDGNIWFTEANVAKVGYISPNGDDLHEFPIVGVDAGRVFTYGIAAGPDGNIWFTVETDDGSGDQRHGFIGRITHDGDITLFPAPGAPNTPMGICAGPDGNLWFADAYFRIGKITTDGAITEYPITASPQFITKGAGNVLWFDSYDAAVGTITTSGDATIYSAADANVSRNMIELAVGSDDDLWFTEYDASAVGRVTPDGTVDEFALSPKSFPFGATLGPDGNIWIAEGSGRLAQITPSGNIREIAVGASLRGVIVGPDGNLWFGDYGADQIGKYVP